MSSAAWRTCQSRSRRARVEGARHLPARGARGRRRAPAPAPRGGGSPGGRSSPPGWRRAPRSSPSAPSAATAASRTSGSCPLGPPARPISVSSTSAGTTSRSPHAHAAISTTVASASPSHGDRSISGRRAASSTARRRTDGVGIIDLGGEQVVVEHAEPVEGAERGRPHTADRRRPAPPRRRRRRPCARRGRPRAGRSLLEQVGERGDDPRQAERRHRGQHGADDDRQPGAGDDRPHPAQRARPAGTGGATASRTW